MDGGDPTTPPRFNCEQCGGEMYPVYYQGIHGQEYKLADGYYLIVQMPTWNKEA